MADPARYDLTRDNNVGVDHAIYQGVRFQLNLTIKDDGVARDLTGHTIHFRVREEWLKNDGTTKGDLIIDMDSANDAEVSHGGTTGQITVDIPDETTTGYKARTDELQEELGDDHRPGVYVILDEDANGNIDPVFYGERVEIVPTGF